MSDFLVHKQARKEVSNELGVLTLSLTFEGHIDGGISAMTAIASWWIGEVLDMGFDPMIVFSGIHAHDLPQTKQ